MPAFADVPWTAALIVLGAFALASAIYWGIALGRIAITRRQIPTADAGVRLARESPPSDLVHVFVPAHNEAAHIGVLIESLRAQGHDRFHVTLALDRCTDGTAERARGAIGDDKRFSIVEINDCPEGWAGKVHAVWHAMRETRFEPKPDYLLFIDADTRLSPDCLGATLALSHARDLDLLSLLSTLTTDRWFERIVQPSAGMELVYQFPLLRCNGRGAPRPFANGQFMLFRQEAYETIGGHEGVRDELLEDLALARQVSESDMVAGVFMAGSVLECRMYESWSEFTRGWKRIYTESARRRHARLLRRGWRKRLTGTLMPVGSLAALLLGGATVSAGGWTAAAAAWSIGGGTLGLLAYALVAGVVLTGLRVPLVYLTTFPAGAWLVGGILTSAARDLRTGTPTQWGGKVYSRESR